jgi:RimJ/RimL family protein N-acetyltransferase
VRLVAARPEHAELCWRWRHETVARQFNPYDDITLDELTMRFGTVGRDLRNQSFKTYRWMVDVEGLGLVGTVSIRANWRMLHGEIGYQIGQEWGRRGLGRAAVRSLVDLAFTGSDLVRLYATISVGNDPSKRLIEAVGFSYEGRLRRHHLIESRFVDQWVYGLLRQEWSARRDENQIS